MGMFIVNPGYNTLVLTAEDAIKMAEILTRSLRYEEKFHGTGTRGEDTAYTYHIWAAEPNESSITLKPMHTNVYEMALHAGKPPKGS